MRPVLTASAFGALILASIASSQQPKNEPQLRQLGEKVESKPANPTDAAIASALATDPDVKMAQAKIQLAEAELAKARQTVTLKVLALKARVEQARSDVRAAEVRLAHVEQLIRAATVPQSELLTARDKVATAQAALAAAEAEWKLLTAAGDATAAKIREFALDPRWLLTTQEGSSARWEAMLSDRFGTLSRVTNAVKGPIPDRLRAVLDKPVKLGAQGVDIPFSEAMEIIKKETGLDVSVRGTYAVPSILSQGEELPVGAWLQLFQDTSGGVFYVREYGLLIADRKAAPPDAPTITEFWKQKPPAPKAEPKPEPVPQPKK